MRQSKKIKTVIFLLLIILFIFFCSESFLITYNYIQVAETNPIINIVKSILRPSFSDLKTGIKEYGWILLHGYGESIKQAISLFTVGDVSSKGLIESYYIYIDSHNYDQLIIDLPQSGFNEVDGYIMYNGKKMQDVKLRFRGDNMWHWYYTKKSWRVKTDKDELIHNSRKLNLVNSTEKSSMIEFLRSTLGAKMGTLPSKLAARN